MKKDELVANVGIIAFFSFMLIQATELKFVRRFGEMGSGFWPIMILSAATFLSILVLIFNTRKYLQEKKTHTGEPQAPGRSEPEIKERRMKLVLSVVCLLIYILIMPYIGFVLSTILYVLVFILALGERRKWVLAISPFLVTAMAVAVFGKFITMPLPRGVGAFTAFSRIFY
jgi:putative tricarboxylic transport membrane protein